MAAGRKKKKPARPIFDSIRKPTPPPGEKIGNDKHPEKAMPSLRKAKYRPKVKIDD